MDLACGCGRNTRLLAASGFQVTGVDIDERCRPYIEAIPGATFVQRDLENSDWLFAPGTFDAIVVNFYLERSLYPFLTDALKEGGFLLYETFMLPYPGFEGNRTNNPDFVLQPMELPEVYGKSMDILAYSQTVSEKGDCFQQFLARKFIRGRREPIVLPSL